MVVCSSDYLIHALTCSYSIQQFEEEQQDDNRQDPNQVTTPGEEHREGKEGHSRSSSHIVCATTKSDLEEQRHCLKRSTTTNKCYGYRQSLNGHHHHRTTISTSPKNRPPRRSMLSTITEDGSVEDLVHESRDWLLKSLLDLDESITLSGE
jgi:hypothetical protein